MSLPFEILFGSDRRLVLHQVIGPDHRSGKARRSADAEGPTSAEPVCHPTDNRGACRLLWVGLHVSCDHAELLVFALALLRVGISVQTFTTTANSVLQLSTEPSMRGRVIAMFMAIALGTTPIGAPIVGWGAVRFGARWALGVGAASGFAAAMVGVYYLMKYEPAIRTAEDLKRQQHRHSVEASLEQEETGATEV